MQEILFPVGRLVAGHPMHANESKDDNQQPKKDKNGNQIYNYYVGVAIPKGSEQHWNQTEWGARIVQAATDPVEGYNSGETRHPSFSWKITDGDSDIPNKNQKIPREQEGWAGHWVVHFSTQIPYGCYHVGRYEPQQVIQRKEEIKRGDYCRVYATVKGNKPSKTPGVYMNPTMFELSRAGIAIESASSGPAASSVFGASAPVLPVGAQVDTSVAAPAPTAPVAQPAPAPAAPAPVVPAHDLVTPPPVAPAPVEERYSYGGQTHTKAQWLAMPGWTEAAFNQHCTRV